MIRGTSVILRALEPHDVNLMMIYENDTEVWPESGTLSPYSRYTLEQFYQSATHDIFITRQLRLAIELISETPQPGRTIGFIDLFEFDPLHRTAGVGILIGDIAERKKGFAYESLMLLTRYSFDVLNMHQLYCHIENSNQASLRLFSKAGFNACGVMRDWIVYNESWHDVTMMQLFRPSKLI